MAVLRPTRGLICLIQCQWGSFLFTSCYQVLQNHIVHQTVFIGIILYYSVKGYLERKYQVLTPDLCVKQYFFVQNSKWCLGTCMLVQRRPYSQVHLNRYQRAELLSVLRPVLRFREGTWQMRTLSQEKGLSSQGVILFLLFDLTFIKVCC